MHILFVFVDGIGLGDHDPIVNPFARGRLSAFRRLAGGRPWLRNTPSIDREKHVFRPIDATLDVEGLPQSGTGQASLFTGVNCARVAGRHYGPYPHSKTRQVLADRNLFKQIAALGPAHEEPSAFANAYPDRFFEYVKRTDRWTVTTRCCLESSVRIRGTEDLRAGLAVPADLTGRRWPDPGEDGLMPATERDAGRRLRRIAAGHRLTLFEYFLTDKAGHRQDMAAALEVLASLDELFDAVLERMNVTDTLLVLTSDHGNLEDLSTKTHTRNDVPFVAYGTGAGALHDVRRLNDVTPALVSLLGDTI